MFVPLTQMLPTSIFPESNSALIQQKDITKLPGVTIDLSLEASDELLRRLGDVVRSCDDLRGQACEVGGHAGVSGYSILALGVEAGSTRDQDTERSLDGFGAMFLYVHKEHSNGILNYKSVDNTLEQFIFENTHGRSWTVQ